MQTNSALNKAIKAIILTGLAHSILISQAKAGVHEFNGNSPKTVGQTIEYMPSAYVYGASGSYNLAVIYQSCDFIIQDHYDEIDACNATQDCYSSSISFPSENQPLFLLVDNYTTHNLGDPYYDNIVVKQFYGKCKFEPRGSKPRSEKGWTQIGFNPANSSWDYTENKFTVSPAQSVVTSSEGSAMIDPNMGTRICGYDGFSNVLDGRYRNPAYIKSASRLMGEVSWREDLDYIVAGTNMKSGLGIYSPNKELDVKAMVLSQSKGQLHETTPQFAGECNSSCTDPAFEIYAIANGKSEKITQGLASQEGAWATKSLTSFSNPRDAMPDSVYFRNETQYLEPEVNQYGQPIASDNLLLPGGSIFGYNSQYFWFR